MATDLNRKMQIALSTDPPFRLLSRIIWKANDGEKAVARALAKAVFRLATPEERAWFKKIEARRDVLKDSQKRLRFATFERSGRKAEGGLLGEITNSVSVTAPRSLFLFHLTRKLLPNTCLEMGAAVGISGSYIAAALALNGRGRLTTLEGAESLAATSRETFNTLGLDNTHVVLGGFQDTLSRTLSALPPVDLAFVDGHHQEHATIEYWHLLKPKLAEGAVVVFDDIAWSAGMRRAWRRIKNDEELRWSGGAFTIGIVGI